MAKRTILVVDDEAEFVDFITERLEAKKFRVLRAFNGKDGLEKARSDKPDLMVLDVTMPGISGFDVCIKLKTDEGLKDMPIIMVTAKFQPNDVEFGKEVGADAYITKPVELDLLLKEINGLLK